MGKVVFREEEIKVENLESGGYAGLILLGFSWSVEGK